MKIITVLAGLGLLLASSVWADEMQEQKSFPFSFAVDGANKVTVEQQGKTKVNAVLPSGKTQLLTELEPVDEEAMAGMPEFPVAQVADFNFDGFNDVAILDGNGYGGVNLFYRLYLWNKSSGSFKEFVDKSSDESGISNPEIDSSKRIVRTSARSGPRWFSTEYHSDKGRLYPAVSTEMLSIGEDAFDYATFKNVAGKVTGHKITGEGDGDATATIQVDKAWLYDKPNAGSKTKMYVIKGDTVTLLDWKAKEGNSFGDDGWYLIRYKGKKIIEKWLDSASLVKG